LEDPGIVGRIIINWIFERLDGGVDCMDLIQHSDSALVNTVMNLLVP
jgi:hypothetical protein